MQYSHRLFVHTELDPTTHDLRPTTYVSRSLSILHPPCAFVPVFRKNEKKRNVACWSDVVNTCMREQGQVVECWSWDGKGQGKQGWGWGWGRPNL